MNRATSQTGESVALASAVATEPLRRRDGAIRRCLLTVLLLVGAALGAQVVATPQAQAYSFTGYIDVAAQCQRQGQFAASFWWYWNPNSWYCYTVSAPAGVTYAGTPNLAAACANQYPTWRGFPRTRPQLVAGNNVFGWRCVNY